MPKTLGDWGKLIGGLAALVSLLVIVAGVIIFFYGLRAEVDNLKDDVDLLMGNVGQVNIGVGDLAGPVGDLAGPEGSVATGLKDVTQQHGEVQRSIEQKVDEKVGEILGVVSLPRFGFLGEAGIIGARPGEATFCGQFYDPEEIVGAVPESKLPDWPCGTTLTVVTVGAVDEEGHYLGVNVKVVDKFPDVEIDDPFQDRIIQLSPKAARAIGLTLEMGITGVFVSEYGGPEE
jgi:hypothetical protein